MENWNSFVDINKVAAEYAEHDWQAIAKEIWNDIGWHNDNAIVSSEDWIKFGEGIKWPALYEIQHATGKQDLPVLGIGNTIAFFVFLKRIKSDYHHPIFAVLECDE